MASLRDISLHAGVSIATASRVLNGSEHPVAEETRRRVLAAAEELGYRRSALARALVTRDSRIVGVIVGDVVDPYFAEIARGAEDVAARQGYLTMICSADRGTAHELEHLRILRDYHAAAVLFAGSGTADDPLAAELAEAVDDVRARGTAVVALAQRDFDAPHIGFDNRTAAYDITDYVLSLGHRRVAFVEGPPGLYTSRQRLEGFQAAMRDAGLDGELRTEGGFTYEAGYAAGVRLMTQGGPPQAIVSVNDEAAIGVLTALRQAGVDVPGAVSVAGIDDTRPARFVELTTIAVPLYELGAVAARDALDERRATRPAGDLVLPHRLTPRATTARRARAAA
jgi:LacI family transcriptional regulator